MTMVVGVRVSASGVPVRLASRVVKAGDGTDESKATVRFSKESDSASLLNICRPRRFEKLPGSDLIRFPMVVR